RRNCTATQLAAASIKVYQWKQHGDASRFRAESQCAATAQWEKQPSPAQCAPGAQWEGEQLSAQEIAQRVGVSTRTIVAAKLVEREAVPEVKAAVESGKLSLKAAENIIKLPKEQQAQAIHVKPERKPRPAADGQVELLQAQIKEMQERIAELEDHRDYLTEELDAALRIIRADEQLAQAWAEVERANKRAFEAKSRVDGLMNERNAAIRRVRALEREHGRATS
ncbi:MAG: hypothetical protein ACP5RV_12545, partial [Thiomonas sp.]